MRFPSCRHLGNSLQLLRTSDAQATHMARCGVRPNSSLERTAAGSFEGPVLSGSRPLTPASPTAKHLPLGPYGNPLTTTPYRASNRGMTWTRQISRHPSCSRASAAASVNPFHSAGVIASSNAAASS